MADDALGDSVADNELLYRAVRNLQQNFPEDGQGVRRISGQVFSEAAMRPSVDRAHLNSHQPERTQRDDTDGVLGIYAHQVRQISTTQNDKNGNPIPGKVYVADVEPVPLEKNPAHAEIYGKPGFDNKSVFRRILEQLARAAEWHIKPEDLRH